MNVQNNLVANIKRLAKFTNNLFDYILLPLIKDKLDNKYEIILIDLSLIGDILVSLPYYYEFLRNLPKKDSYIIVSNSTTSIILKSLGFNVIPIKVKQFRYNPLYRLRVLKKIGKVNYSIITHPNRTEQMEDLILSIPSLNRIAYEGEYIYEYKKNNKSLDSFFLIKNPFKEKIVHITKHLSIIFSTLANIFHIKANFNFKKENYLSLFSILKAKYCSELSKSLKAKKYIVIITDASVKYRQYPLNYWQKILDSLPKDIIIVQLGLTKFPLYHSNLLDLTGKTTLKEAMSIVMNASLVIGNETGLTHLAYLSGVPTVCILGGGHYGRFLPWLEFNELVKSIYSFMDCFQCGWDCKYVNLQKGETPPCITQIAPIKILNAIDELNEKYNIFF